jgi:exopolysaccharide biosynthesis WecB/TagA/CpsF family protein
MNWLLARRELDTVTTVTWLNHYSAQIALDSCGSQLRDFDVVGIDGLALCKLIKAPARTSADLLLPRLLPELRNARVLIVGGSPDALTETIECVEGMLNHGSVVIAALDGYEDVANDEMLEDIVLTSQPDIVIVGMGAPRQEIVAQQIAKMLRRGLVFTCGGFLDQIRQGNYYPAWAYPLRLNWAVRLVREPKRLWRRYTVQALSALRIRRRLREEIWSLEGFSAHAASFAAGSAPLTATPDLVIDLTDATIARQRVAETDYADLSDTVLLQRKASEPTSDWASKS